MDHKGGGDEVQKGLLRKVLRSVYFKAMVQKFCYSSMETNYYNLKVQDRALPKSP